MVSRMSRRILILSTALAAAVALANLASGRAASAAVPPAPEKLSLELESVTEDGVAVDAKPDTAQIVNQRDGLTFFGAGRSEEFHAK